MDIKHEVKINALKTLDISLNNLSNREFNVQLQLERKRRHLEKLSNTIKQMETDIQMASRDNYNALENKRLINVLPQNHKKI